MGFKSIRPMLAVCFLLFFFTAITPIGK